MTNFIKTTIIWLIAFVFSCSVFANNSEKLNFSPLFISLSDAMGAIKENDKQHAKDDLLLIEARLNDIGKQQNRKTALFDEVWIAFNNAKNNPNDETLKELSIKLYAYEKEQNPVDYSVKRREFAKNIQKPLDDLNGSVNEFNQNKDIDKLKSFYDAFNKSWVANERVVRNTSMAHYGKIETAMAMMRVGIENTPPNLTMISDNMTLLKQTIDSYNQGDKLQSQQNNKDPIDLNYGISLLEQGLIALQNNDKQNAKKHLGEFIAIWASIEGDVRTKNVQLYTDIESHIPVIMAKGDTSHQKQLAQLINDLKAINQTAHYTAFDSMFILLREGLEALLVVVALMSALNASGQSKGKYYVYGGVGLGLFGSVVGALALYALFPQVAGGASREALEGVVGIVAVLMMIGVGAWLHSKSSVQAWNAYIRQNLNKAMSKSGFFSLFLLSFLAVFREGAETILFYVGILPNIALSSFLLGIFFAVAILVLLAVVLLKTSLKLPIPLLFKILTIGIYLLGFKMLGVSILALQLTNHLPRTILDFTAIPMIGIYPSVQGLLAQGLYVLLLVVLANWGKIVSKFAPTAHKP